MTPENFPLQNFFMRIYCFAFKQFALLVCLWERLDERKMWLREKNRLRGHRRNFHYKIFLCKFIVLRLSHSPANYSLEDTLKLLETAIGVFIGLLEYIYFNHSISTLAWPHIWFIVNFTRIIFLSNLERLPSLSYAYTSVSEHAKVEIGL